MLALYTIEELFDLEHTAAAPLMEGKHYPWQVLPEIGAFICALGQRLPPELYEQRGDAIWIARSAQVAPTVSISGPCIVGPGAELRHCAFLRGKVLVGADAVVGNSTELKNAILFDGVQVPHYNYVGDSILGYRAHMGAGAVTLQCQERPHARHGSGRCATVRNRPEKIWRHAG